MNIKNMTSQHRIELFLKCFFTEPGFFLEIGAWDGETISQTAYLERVKGWKGLCVDPFPKNFLNRTCEVCDKAISKDGLPRDFIKVSIDRRNGGDVSYFSGFKDVVTTHWQMIKDYCNYEIVKVETITINNLYKQYNLPEYIEFLSVDTEGSELEIFESIDFSKSSFGLIVFEHNRDEVAREAISKILNVNGYKFFCTIEIDDIYINKNLF